MKAPLQILITHECSGEVRRAVNRLGHSATSCDLKASEDCSAAHIQGDAIAAICSHAWSAIILHPPCTFLNGAGLHWNNRGRGWARTDAALRHVEECVAACGDKPFALENPVGILSTRWRKPDQIIQPYQFGDDASKQTCLWLSGLPRLHSLPPEQWVKPRWVCPKCRHVSLDAEAQSWKLPSGHLGCKVCSPLTRLLPRWANQTDSGQNRLGPSAHRAADRARTYPGIAAAMAAPMVPVSFRSLTLNPTRFLR